MTQSREDSVTDHLTSPEKSAAESAAHRLSTFVRTEFDKESDESWEKLNELHQAALRERASNAYRPSADELTRSEIQGDRIAVFRAEY